MPTDYQRQATPAGEPRRTVARHARPRDLQQGECA